MIYIFFLSSFFPSPNLSGRRLDVYHTSTHGVALVQIQDAGLKRAARGSLKIQDPNNRQKFGIWALLHNFVGLLSSQLRHISTIGKNLLSSNTCPTCPYNMVNFGPLAAEIGLVDWATPANFNGFASWHAALLHDTLLVCVSETLRR